MTLHTKILDAARDEVAKRDYNTNFKYVVENGTYSSIIRVMDEASEKAMEKQAEFFRWASEEQYLIWSNNYWVRFKTYEAEGHHFTLTGNREHGITEIELYEIWEGQRNEG